MNNPEISDNKNTKSGVSDALERQSYDEVLKSAQEAVSEKLTPLLSDASVEAILFAYGDPISLEKLADILETEKKQLKTSMDRIIRKYEEDSSRGLIIREIDGNYCFSTKPGQKKIMEKLFLPKNRPPMSQAAYETLAIIAYNQPVTRSQVESVRGVSSDSIIGRLAEKGLIKECGTLDAPGRPVLFETTNLFLKEFGLSSVNELPPMDMMMYGTLRDIENAISDSADRKKDNQITIDQIIKSVIPGQTDSISPEKENIDDGIDSQEIVNISSALFGNESEEDSE